VDATARLQAQLLVEESGLDSMRQIYGDGNVRIRATEARIATLQREIAKMGGSSSPLISSMNAEAGGREAVVRNELYPPLRQLPRLAVPYADLYRRVRVQEAVFEFLTQQYEMARIEEAKDVPVVSVIDPPGVPEKKSFPPRLLLALALTAFLVAGAAALVLMYDRWETMRSDDARKVLVGEIWESMRQRFSRVRGQS
jgi:capsule polysaccharide export protein KpsE/RkpR